MLSLGPRGRLSRAWQVGAMGYSSVKTSGRHLFSSSAITPRSLLYCLQFAKGPLDLADQRVVNCVKLTTNTFGSSIWYREVIP